MDYKSLKTNFERELLYQVIIRIREKRLTLTRAQKIAIAFLPAVKEETPELFLQRVSKVSEGFPELTEAFIASVSKYEQENQTSKLNEVRRKLKGGEK